MNAGKRIIKGVESESITIFVPSKMKEDLKVIGNNFAASGLRRMLNTISKEIEKEADHIRKITKRMRRGGK